jgi:hypothetical protein
VHLTKSAWLILDALAEIATAAATSDEASVNFSPCWR